MLVQRRRRWTNIEPTLGQCIVLARSVNMCVCLHGYRGFVPRSGIQISKKQINVSSPLTRKIQYCREPLRPRGSVLGLRPPGIEFGNLCLQRSAISFISPSSGGPVYPIRAQRLRKTSFHHSLLGLHGPYTLSNAILEVHHLQCKV